MIKAQEYLGMELDFKGKKLTPKTVMGLLDKEIIKYAKNPKLFRKHIRFLRKHRPILSEENENYYHSMLFSLRIANFFELTWSVDSIKKCEYFLKKLGIKNIKWD